VKDSDDRVLHCCCPAAGTKTYNTPNTLLVQWRIQEFGMGEAEFSLLPNLPFPLLFPLILPSLPLEVGPLNPVRGSGEGCKIT